MFAKIFSPLVGIMLLAGCGGGSSSGPSGNPTAPIAATAGYLISSSMIPTSYSGLFSAAGVSALGEQTSGTSSSGADLPSGAFLGCSNAVVNTTTVPGKVILYDLFISDTGSTAYLYTYEFTPNTGVFTLLGTTNWSNPSNSCPSLSQPVLSTAKGCLFLSGQEAVTINQDGVAGSMINPNPTSDSGIAAMNWLTTDSTGALLVGVYSESPCPGGCYMNGYTIQNGCTLSLTSHVNVDFVGPSITMFVPNNDTLLVTNVAYFSGAEQYLVNTTGASYIGGTSIATPSGMSLESFFLSPDEQELYVSNGGASQSTLNEYSVLSATPGISLTLQSSLSNSIGGGTGFMAENVAPNAPQNGSLMFTVGFPLISLSSNGTLTGELPNGGSSGSIYIPVSF